jgi:hypothetical protein
MGTDATAFSSPCWRITVMKKTISIPEAARRAGIFSTYLYELAKNGKVKAEKVDGRWAFDLAAFEAWHTGHRKVQTKRRARTSTEATEMVVTP